MKKILTLLLVFFLFIGLLSPAVLADTTVSDFAGLRTAIASAPADGTPTTISLQSSISAPDGAFGNAIIIASGQNIILTGVSGTNWLEQTNTNQRHFIVMSGGYLTLQNITLRGANTSALVSGGVEVRGGTLIMQSGSQISGNRAGSGGGGAVLVNNQGAFIMNGGAIAMNSTSWSGGAVLVDNGNFTMSGDSIITRNSGTATGGGVEVRNNSSFTMLGGTISSNAIPTGTANTGGGVEVRVGSTFTMENGLITDNIAAYGGGVHVSADSKFIMNAGAIRYNTAAFNGGGIFSTNNSYANTLPAGAFSNLTIQAEAEFFGNIARNGVRRPPTNPQITNIFTAKSSIFNHPINNFDINYQPPASTPLISDLEITFKAGDHGTFADGTTETTVLVPVVRNPRLPYPIPEVTESGLYTFIGWSSDDGVTVISSMDIMTTPLNDNITYTAQYLAPPPPVNITFNANSGTFLPVGEFLSGGESVRVIPNMPVTEAYREIFPRVGVPVRDGYVFIGWFTEQFGGSRQPVQIIGSRPLIQTDHTLYAAWVSLGQGIIAIGADFDANGGIFADGEDVRNVRYGVIVGRTYENALGAVPKPTRDGYEFEGWYFDPENVLTRLDIDTVVTIYFSGTIYARWRALPQIPTINLIFDALGGEPALQNAQLLSGEPYAAAFSEITEPTREGYTFFGWFTDPVIGVRMFPAEPVTLDRTLFAHWIETPPEQPRPPDPPPGHGPQLPPSDPPQQPEQPDLEYYPDADDAESSEFSITMILRENISITDIHYAYIIGTDENLVNPMGRITRAETATVLERILSPESRAHFWTLENPFPDVPDNGGVWFSNAVSLASSAELIMGMPDGTFQPNRPITRAEVVTVLTRKLADDIAFTGSEDLFPDIADSWGRDAINLAGQLGWIQGDGNGRFNPNANVSRAEFVTIINRLLQRTADDIDTAQMLTWADNDNPNAWYYWDIQIASNSAPDVYTPNWVALQRPNARPGDAFR